METSSLTFAAPLWLWTLAIVPAAAVLYAWSQRRSRSLVARVVAPRLRSELAGAVSTGRRVFKAALVLAAMACLAFALARPQWGYIQREVKQRGRDVVIALDTSRSMLATDVSPTRLARAKLVAQDLLQLLRGDRVGLVAFAGSAFLQAPLTLDQGAILASLDEIDTTIIPKGGTNIAAAIGVAEEAFGKAEGKTRALVILTDGEELDADGIAAARRAAEKGIRIFTVGIGSAEGSLIPLRRETGGTDFVRDNAGKPVQSRLDATRLKEIAAAGDGFYEPLNSDVAQTIFTRGILPLEMSETGVQTSRQPIERYQWPLGLGLLLLFVWLVLGEKKRGRARQPRAVALAALVVLTAAGPALGGTGLDEYQAGNYGKAMADFEHRLKAEPESDKLQFNAGAAAYKLGDFEKAVDYFTHSLLTQEKELQEQSFYNLANALFRRGEQLQEKDRKKADWKNAIQHYDQALKLDSKNKEARENREIVKKMLEELEKEEKQEQQQQQQDQQDKSQQNKNQQQNQQKQDQKDQQQNKDQQQDQKNQQGSGQQKESQSDAKDQEKQDQPSKQDQKKNEEAKGDEKKSQDQPPEPQKSPAGDKENQDGKKPQPPGKEQEEGRQEMARNQPQKSEGKDRAGQQPAPQPTPGEKKEGELKASSGNQPQKGEGGETEVEIEREGEMSKAQARNLLNSLRTDEERVRLIQREEMEDVNRDW